MLRLLGLRKEKHIAKSSVPDRQPYGFVNPVYIDVGITSPTPEELVDLKVIARDIILQHSEGIEFHKIPIVNRQYFCSLAAMNLFHPLPFILENDDFGEFGGQCSVTWEVIRVPSVDNDRDILIRSTQTTLSDQITGVVTRKDIRSAQFSVETGDLVSITKETWITEGTE